MKTRNTSAIAILLIALPALASANDTWVVKNIARHTGMSTDQVVAVVGNRMELTEHQYTLHPSRRTEIQRLVLKGRDATVGAQPAPRAEKDQPVQVLATLEKQP